LLRTKRAAGKAREVERGQDTNVHPKLLRIERVTKKFPGVRALEEVSFDLERGEIHAVVGQNGAGKSTLMHILAGVVRPDSGRILIDGHEGASFLCNSRRDSCFNRRVSLG
jgi:ABC-type sugar transport system ATPase subunit